MPMTIFVGTRCSIPDYFTIYTNNKNNKLCVYDRAISIYDSIIFMVGPHFWHDIYILYWLGE